MNLSRAKHWSGGSGSSNLAAADAQNESESATNLEKPRMRSMSENRAQSVAQSGVIQMNGDPDSIKQLFLDNARMWDCLCLMKSDPTLLCESAIRVIFSLEDVHFLLPSEETSGYGLDHFLTRNSMLGLTETENVELEKQRLTIENSRLHAVLWVLRDNPSLQVDSTVAAVFRMDDSQVQEKFGIGIRYSPGCLSLLMKIGSKWKARSGKRSPIIEATLSHALRSNRSRSVSSREMGSQLRRLHGVKHLWSRRPKEINSTGNWKATVSEDREPTKKGIAKNTIWLMPGKKGHPKSQAVEASTSAVYTSPAESGCNTNVNRMPQNSTDLQTCCSNNADSTSEASRAQTTDCLHLKRFPSGLARSYAPHYLNDYYLHQRQALHKYYNKFWCKRALPNDLIPKTTTVDDKESRSLEMESRGKRNGEKPIISLSSDEAYIHPPGKQYSLPEFPIPRYFIERHKVRQAKVDLEYPMKSDLRFSFNSKLRVPNLAVANPIGQIDANNEIIQLCSQKNQETGQREEAE